MLARWVTKEISLRMCANRSPCHPQIIRHIHNIIIIIINTITIIIASQLMVGVWLIACLILRASYTCSLISHLIVQGKSEAINSLEELVGLQRSKGWKWGTRTFDGAFNSLLTISTNQDYHTIKEHMQASMSEV